MRLVTTATSITLSHGTSDFSLFQELVSTVTDLGYIPTDSVLGVFPCHPECFLCFPYHSHYHRGEAESSCGFVLGFLDS